jgi:hypothetical protein
MTECDCIFVKVLKQEDGRIKKYVGEKYYVPLILLNENYEENNPLEEVCVSVFIFQKKPNLYFTYFKFEVNQIIKCLFDSNKNFNCELLSKDIYITKPGVFMETVESNKRLLSLASSTQIANKNKSRKIANRSDLLDDNEGEENNNVDNDVAANYVDDADDDNNDDPFLNEAIQQLNKDLNATNLETISSESENEDITVNELLSLAKKNKFPEKEFKFGVVKKNIPQFIISLIVKHLLMKSLQEKFRSFVK